MRHLAIKFLYVVCFILLNIKADAQGLLSVCRLLVKQEHASAQAAKAAKMAAAARAGKLALSSGPELSIFALKNLSTDITKSQKR